jgi:hypothetical protein
MSADSLTVLAATAAGLGFLHTAVGVDHYLPFIALGRARHWPLRRTLLVTALCGGGHVAGSLLLGAVGLGLGLALGRLTLLEAQRGNLANLLLIGLGLVFAAWGLYRARRDRSHAHPHAHADGTVHRHLHDHTGSHVHPHAEGGRRQGTAIWWLFIIFVFGPCEALIPLLAGAAAHGGTGAAFLVAIPFAACTIGTMLILVTLGHLGTRFAIPVALERHVHTAAGLAIALSGLTVRLLGT